MTRSAGNSPAEGIVNGDPAKIPKVVRAVAEPFVAAKNAMSLGVGVVHNGEAHTDFYGRVKLGGNVGPDERTLYEIGSITKVFTTTLLADMHLKGEVDLDDPASKYLPATVILRSREGIDVTLRHLATHTSGLPRIPSNISSEDLHSDNPYANYSVEDLCEFLSKPRLESAPGLFYSYSNIGMGLLGHVLALVAGMDYEALVIERICVPLGMNDTAITLSDDLRDRLAPGHADGAQVSNWDVPTLAGCGALRSTVRDMTIFLKANMHPEDTPLLGAIELTQTLQPREKLSWRNITWRAVMPGRLNPILFAGLVAYACLVVAQGGLTDVAVQFLILAVAFALPMTVRWLLMSKMCLGWHVLPGGVGADGRERRILWHNGGTGGYRSYTAFAEGQDCGVVVLSNSTDSPDAIGRQLLDRLISFGSETE
jgi:CubicO group peptidase (beta-lactamase class C family)